MSNEKPHGESVSQSGLLSPQERAVCERVASGDAPHGQRAQALLALDEGVTQSEAGERAGLTLGQVRYWLGRFRQRGLGIFPDDVLEAVGDPGRPKGEPPSEEGSAKAGEPEKAKKDKKPKKTKGKTDPSAKKSGKGAKKGKKAKEVAVAKKKEKKPKKMSRKEYERELAKLEVELVKLQGWIKHEGLKVVVIFEGRDSAGKGGIIKRITRRLSPRVVRVVALATPTPKEKTQWYFQRYVEQLPSAGEMVLFDRSWYNRAGVEPVMGFCTDEEYEQFMNLCPGFEKALVDSGVILIKYWLHITDETQEKRFEQRIHDPRRRWKLSPMDLEARARWVEYSKARDAMLLQTDTGWAPWYIVDANVKRHARLNCISHLLTQIPYEDLTPEPLKLPPRQKAKGYKPPDVSQFHIVPAVYP